MANNFIGAGILFGFPGTSLTATIVGVADITLLQDMELSHTAENEQIKDGSNNTKTLVYSDHNDSLSVNFYPTSGTATGSATFAARPSAGATLAFTDANFSPITATFALDKVTHTRSNSKAMMMRLELSRYLNNAVP